jgi:hypothetical protein
MRITLVRAGGIFVTTWTSATAPTAPTFVEGEFKPLKNGDFEDGSGTLPDNWEQLAAGDSGWEWYTSKPDSQSNDKCMRVAAGDDTTSWLSTDKPYRFKNGKSYTLTFWYKGNSVPAILQYRIRTAQNWSTSGSTIASGSPANASAWTQVTKSFTGDGKSGYLIFQANVQTSDYTIHIDNVAITETGVTWTNATHPTTTWS